MDVETGDHYEVELSKLYDYFKLHKNKQRLLIESLSIVLILINSISWIFIVFLPFCNFYDALCYLSNSL